MPFAVWCTTCKPHETIIGQGVRFNAEKKKIGNYYSTPIYSFRMKHTVCGGWIEIRTDPQNTAYVVVEGGRKRDTGEDKEPQPGEISIRLPGSKDETPHDPLAKLEGKVEDKRRAQTETSRILELQERQLRDWDDPYEKSKRLRRSFRAERKGLEKAEAGREALKDKMSLGIELVDETEEDRRRAGIVDFGENPTLAGMMATRVTRVRPMFENGPHNSSSEAQKRGKRDKGNIRHRKAGATSQAAERKKSLRQELTGNTRAAMDPFLNDVGDSQRVWRAAVKRKKPSSTTSVGQETPNSAARVLRNESQERVATIAGSSLVSYASDSG